MSDRNAAMLASAVERYIALRDERTALKRRYQEEDVKLRSQQDAIEAAMLEFLNKTGSESIRTGSGTFYKSTQSSVRMEDWEAFLDYVQKNERWDLLHRAASKSAVEEYLTANGELVPGVSMSRITTVNIRRS